MAGLGTLTTGVNVPGLDWAGTTPGYDAGLNGYSLGPNSFNMSPVPVGALQIGNTTPAAAPASKPGVLGASTNIPNNLGGVVNNNVNGTGYNQAQLDAYNAQFGSQISRLNSQLGYIPADQQKANDLLNSTYNPQFSTLQSSLDSANRNLDFSAGQNQQNETKSFRDIATGIRNSIQATNNHLGTMGSADSSTAQVFAPYAFAQLQATQKGAATDNFNTNQTQINLKRQDAQSQHDNQFQQLQADKGNRIQAIADQYNQLRQSILDQMATADGQRRQLLAAANQKAAASAIANIQGLEVQYKGLSDQITQRAMAGIPTLQPTDFNSNVALNQYNAPTNTAATVGAVNNADAAVSNFPLFGKQNDQIAY